jgi:hypothetical protein
MKNSFLLIMVITAFLITGCKNDDSTNLTPELLSFWKFEGYSFNNNFESIPDTINIDLFFGSLYTQGNDFEGESSFRNYWGRFRLDKDKISMTDLRVTDVLTYSDSVSYYKIEKKYLTSLIRSKKYSIKDNILTLHISDDSLMVFSKNESTIYDEGYSMTALYDGAEWAADTTSVRAVVEDWGLSALQMFTLYADPVLKSSDGNLYSLQVQVYHTPKKGKYYVSANPSVSASSFVYFDPNTNRAESASGYLRISRVSRSFIIGEFEFQMKGYSKEFAITGGKFKAVLRDISSKRLYIKYQ